MVIRLGQKNMLESLEQGITNGKIVLLENITEELDPVLDSLLARNLIKKGRYDSAMITHSRLAEYYRNYISILQGYQNRRQRSRIQREF